MSKLFYQINSDELLVGSVSGSIDDAKMYVESQIEHHFSIPKRCKFNIKKASDDLYHFEIHQGESVGAILKYILPELDEKPESDLFIFSSVGSQYQIYKRPDGSLRTFVHTGEDQVRPEKESDIEFLEGNHSVLSPFHSTLKMAVWISGIVFGISLSLALVAGSAMATLAISESGYKKAVEDSVLNFAVPENNAKNFKTEKAENLPYIGGVRALNIFMSRSEESVGRLEYNNKLWKVFKKQK